jgi:hypothetical protein
MLGRLLTWDDIFKWISIRQPTKTPGLKLSQALTYGHSQRQRFSKKPPRLKATSWHRADIGKFLFRIFWPVSPSESPNKTNYFSPKLKFPLDERSVNKLRHKCVRSNEEVPSGTKCRESQFGPLGEKLDDTLTLFLIQGGKARKW